MTWIEGPARRERIQTALTRLGIDALLALLPENAAYLSGRISTIATLWRVPGLVAIAINRDSDLAVAAGDAELSAYPPDQFARFAYQLWIERLDLRDITGDDLMTRIRAARTSGALNRPAQYDLDEVFTAIANAVRAVAPAARRVGADLATLPAASLDRLLTRLPDVELVDATAAFDDLRAVKDMDEIACLRLAAELTEVGIAAVRDALRPGLTETGVNAAYHGAIWQRAAADPRFAALRQVEGLVTVGSGSGSRVVGPGQTVKLDMQVDVGGYHSDIGRTYAIAPTADQRLIYSALRDALATALAVIKPGATFREVYDAGIQAMRRAGFTSYSRGHLGHSVGLAHNFEEPPFIAADEGRPLVSGMVVSLELPYYLDGIGSFQLERMVLVTPDGHEPLDRLPFEFEVDTTR